MIILKRAGQPGQQVVVCFSVKWTLLGPSSAKQNWSGLGLREFLIIPLDPKGGRANGVEWSGMDFSGGIILKGAGRPGQPRAVIFQ